MKNKAQPKISFYPAGLTLLEVLISVFVLIVALLGLISVLPLVQNSLSEVVVLERARACAEHAIHCLRNEQSFDQNAVGLFPISSPFVWRTVSQPPNVLSPALLLTAPPLLNISTDYCVDPWIISQALTKLAGSPVNPAGLASLQRCPWAPFTSVPFYNPAATLTRVTVSSPAPSPAGGYFDNPAWQKPRWLRVFFFEDSPVVGDAPSEVDRPEAIPGRNRQDYSWLATISFDDDANDSNRNIFWTGPRRATISIAVFHRRDSLTPVDFSLTPVDFDANSQPDCPPERTMIATILNPLWSHLHPIGGESVEIAIPVPFNPPAYLDNIRKNQWILMFAWIPAQFEPSSGFPIFRSVARWFRVVSEPTFDAQGRLLLSLEGPNAPLPPGHFWTARYPDNSGNHLQDVNGDGAGPDVQIGVLDNVIAVYTFRQFIY